MRREFMATETKLETGASFLTKRVTEEHFLTPEKLDEEQRQIQEAAATFIQREVQPKAEEIRHQEPGLMASLVKLAGEQGLLMIDVPEEYGGADLGLVVSALVAHEMRDASFAVAHGAHTTIGTLPIVFYGTDAQKRAYLPKLATGEYIGAYALTEPGVGSDAMSIRTRASLAEDGQHYILNGAKQWISNAGFADVMVVFAKIDDTKHSAFIVETKWEGISTGAEEKKVGIKGSSTRTVYFDNVHVPVENLLGEIGKGYKIAFNILNIGRLKLGPGAVGGAKNVLAICLKYAKERKAFGSAIAEFGAIRHKLAEIAIRTFAVESMVWRVVGLIESQLARSAHDHHADSQIELKAVEEYAAECSMIKVYASEMLDYVVDEGVQIHGGYGYHQDYAVERAYRDSRVNRIFQGTNEINRILITGMLLKRAARSQLALMQAVEAVMKATPHATNGSAPSDEEAQLVHNAKKIALFMIGIAYQQYGAELEKQQEVLMNISDIAMEVLAMESTLLRTRKLAASGRGTNAADMCAVFLRDGMDRVEVSARSVIGACSSGNALRENMAILRRFANYDPLDAIALRRDIAGRLLAAGTYAI